MRAFIEVVVNRSSLVSRSRSRSLRDEPGPLGPDEEKCHSATVDFEEAGYEYFGRHFAIEYLYVHDVGIGVTWLCQGMQPRARWDHKELVWAGCSFVAHADLPYHEGRLRSSAENCYKSIMKYPPHFGYDDGDDEQGPRRFSACVPFTCP
jgi:hypothetical protein